MREIKFRAWNGKEMIERALGADIHEASKEFGIDFPASYSPYFSPATFNVLMQFTGLLDKNGKEIWEGDLLEEDPGYLFEAVWDTTYAKFRLQWRTKAIQYPEWNRGKAMSVIGNIHEHYSLVAS